MLFLLILKKRRKIPRGFFKSTLSFYVQSTPNGTEKPFTDLRCRSCAWCMLFWGDIRKLALKIQNELVPLYKSEIEPLLWLKKFIYIFFIYCI